MSELKRDVKCSNCGSETAIYLSTAMAISEILMHGKCTRCGNSLQLNYTLVEQQNQSNQASTNTQSTAEPTSTPNLDQALFDQEFPNESIKDLIDG